MWLRNLLQRSTKMAKHITNRVSQYEKHKQKYSQNVDIIYDYTVFYDLHFVKGNKYSKS